ncbi:MAG: hypothetical protein Q9200_000210 [Gallowayella weberi]
MPFGWPQYHKAVGDAINHATTKNILICAAASNGGANDDVAFPASYPPVIRVHSTNEQGKPSNFTPNHLPFEPNFAVLGENVPAAWPGQASSKCEKRLRDHRVMKKVLLAMSDEVEAYHYVRPWKLMTSTVERARVESRILDAIES